MKTSRAFLGYQRDYAAVLSTGCKPPIAAIAAAAAKRRCLVGDDG